MSYRERNRGIITWSKFCCFETLPELYKLKYVDEVIPESHSLALTMGTALDVYVQDEFDDTFVVVGRQYDVAEKIESLEKEISELKQELGDKSHKSKEKKLERLVKNLFQERKNLNKQQITTAAYNKVIECVEELRSQPLYHCEDGANQHSFTFEYRGHTFGGTLDVFLKDKKLISDVKTAASIDGLYKPSRFYQGRPIIDKYFDQLTWYQWLVEKNEKIVCDGELQVVTKESPPRSCFFWADSDQLYENRIQLIERIDRMVDMIDSNTYPTFHDIEEPSGRMKLLRSEVYGYSPHSKQKEHIPIDYRPF